MYSLSCISFILYLYSEIVAFRETNGSLHLDESHIISVLKWAQNRISKLSDLVSSKLHFLWIMPTTALNDTHLEYLGIISTCWIFHVIHRLTFYMIITILPYRYA